MGMKAVAEGIEDVDTWRALQAIGCDVGQGFYFCRPLPIADFLDWSFEWDSSRPSRLLGTIGDHAQPGFWSQ
jgi:EAL domain-containing protein (putative c-di-GMP-specific phosphodiesterase class I)